MTRNDPECGLAGFVLPSHPRIVTYNTFPPIPTRQFDWCAYFDGEEERGGYGYGPTEQEAILDLIENHPHVGDIDCECAGKPLRDLSAFIFAMVGLAAFFSPMPDGWSAQAAILTPEGQEAYANLIPLAIGFAVLVAIFIAIRWLDRAPIPPFIGGEEYGPSPERTIEQRVREGGAGA